jgi:ABC-2 type transport system permease protein
MTTATLPTAPSRLAGVGLTFPRLVRSEWIKLWTVRSTWWALPVTVLAQAGFGLLLARLWVTQADSVEPLTADLIVAGLQFSQLVISVLAVLAITGEYRTGMIRSTLTAVPRRLPALWAKGLVVVAVSLVTGVVATALTWAVTLPVLRGGYAVDLADPTNRRILLGAPLYLAAIALLAYGFGALLRHSAAALATVLGLLLIVENVVYMLRGVRFFEVISPFLPQTAGSRIVSATSAIGATEQARGVVTLTPWQGYGVLVAWGLLILAVASVLLRRRDA